MFSGVLPPEQPAAVVRNDGLASLSAWRLSQDAQTIPRRFELADPSRLEASRGWGRRVGSHALVSEYAALTEG